MRYFLLLLFCVLSTFAFGQKADSTAKEPPVEIPTLEAAWKPVIVEHHIGLRFGWGFGSMRREPNKTTVGLPWSLWNLNIAYRFDVPAQKYVGCIEFDLGIMQKGYAYKHANDGDLAYGRIYNTIELPILWQPYFPIGKQGTRIYLSAGPFLSYTISGTEREFNATTGEIIYEQPVKYDDLQDYFWGFGITAGGGIVVAIKRFSINAEFRYTIGLSDIIRGPEFVPGNPFRTPVDQMSISLGVQYKFSLGKKKQADE